MPNNPLLPADILNYYQWSAQNGINPPQLPAGYVLATDPTTTGILALRLFDAAYITTGIIDPNRLGTGATGAGNLYLADDGVWKPVAGGGGGGDMYKATYDIDNSGIVDKAEALTTLGRNSTGATLYEGTIVRIEGSTGNRPNFVKAQANNDANSAQTFGVVMTDIANNSDGYVLVQGTLHDLDTRTGGGGATHPFTDVTLVDGDLLFLHPTIPGYITNIKPSAPQHLVYVGVVTRTSPTNGTIVYRIQNGYELYELHDVAPTPYINNGVLYRDTATNLWKSATIDTILGGTPLLTIPTLAQVTTAGNTTTNAITVGGFTSNASSTIVGAAAGTIGTRVLTIEGSHPEIWFKDTFVGEPSFALSQYGSAFYFARTSSTGVFTSYAGVIVGASWSFGHGGNPTATVHIKGSDVLSSTKAFLVQNSSPSDLLTIWNDGAVGINTSTNAGYKLDVNGTARVQGAVVAQLSSPTSDAFYTISSSAIGFYTSNSYTKAQKLNLTNAVGVPSAPNNVLAVSGSITAASALAQGVLFNNTLVAAANNDVLVGLDINPTFTNGAFTGVTNLALRVQGNTEISRSGADTQLTIARGGGASLILQAKANSTSSSEGVNLYWTANTWLKFVLGSSVVANFSNVGNLLVGTSTDAGYKLDVIGSGRIKGAGTTSATTAFVVQNSLSSTTFSVRDDGRVLIPGSTVLQGFTQIGLIQFYPVLDGLYGASSTGRVLRVDTTFDATVSSTYAYQLGAFSLETGTASNINGTSIFTTLAPTSGSKTFTTLNVASTINATGTYSGIVRGIYYNPTLTSITGVTHRAIETTSGDVIFNGGNLTVDTNTLFVDATNDRVGIGTTSPTYKLEASSAGYTAFGIMSGANNNAEIHFQNTGYGLPRWTIRTTGTPNGSSGNLTFQRLGSTFPLTITSGDNVLIGTTTDAGYKLDVNGTARIVNKTNIGSETVSQGSLYVGHNGTAGGSNGTSTVFFVSQFGNYPYRLGAEGNGYDFYLRQANGGQGSINIDFSGLNSISYNITNTNVLNQSFGKSVVIDAKMSLNSYLAIGTRFGYSDSVTAGDSPLIFFRSMSGSYFDKTLDAAVTIRNGLPTVADNNITKNTAYWYRNGYIGIGTSTTFSATNTLKGAITINQGTTIGYQNLTPGSLSSVITSGTSTTVTFTPNNGNGVPGYDIIVGTIITANGVSRRVTAVNYQSVTVDSAVDWSAGYNYTYRNPYVSIADGSTPIFDILPSGNVAVGTTTGLAKFTVAGSITAASLIAQGVYFNNTLVAAANNDVLVGLDINPTFTNGAFTGVSNLTLRVKGSTQYIFTTGDGLIFNRDGAGNYIRPITQPLVLYSPNSSVYQYINNSGVGINTPPSARLHIKGSGTTTSTTSLRVENSSGTVGLIVNDAGNTLLGTTTDAGYKLDVNGTARFAGQIAGSNGLSITGGNIISQTGANSGRMTMLNLRNTGGGFQSAVGTSLAIAFTNREVAGVWTDDVIENVVYSNTAGAVTTGYSFYTHSNQLYNTSPVLAMSINGTNVGIGIASPTEKLHIVDNSTGNKFARISAGAADASAAWVAQNDLVDNIVYRVFGSGVSGTQMGVNLARSASLIANLDGTGKFLIGTYSNTDVVFGAGDQERMRLINNTGNFLIGTTVDVGTKLNVSGDINAMGYRINNVIGYTGILNIPGNPPGMQNVDIQGGIIVNIF